MSSSGCAFSLRFQLALATCAWPQTEPEAPKGPRGGAFFLCELVCELVCARAEIAPPQRHNSTQCTVAGELLAGCERTCHNWPQFIPIRYNSLQFAAYCIQQTVYNLLCIKDCIQHTVYNRLYVA